MSNAFSGAASAQRINEALDIEASQREFMDSVKPGRIVAYHDEEPMNRRDLIALSLYWIAACVLVGLAFYGAANLAEAMR